MTKSSYGGDGGGQLYFHILKSVKRQKFTWGAVSQLILSPIVATTKTPGPFLIVHS